MHHDPLQLIYLPTPNMNVERHCAPVTCMVSGDILLSNSGISKVPYDGKEQWVRPLGPHNRTHQTISLVVSPTPLQHPVRKMCKEGGANLVHFLMGKALTTHEPQYESIHNWSYKDIARLPQAEQKLW